MTPEWSTRYEHGCSQLIDWISWIENGRNSLAHQARFGVGVIHYNTLLVIGRDRDLAVKGLRERFEWRNDSVVVSSRKLHCITFDQLRDDLEARLAIFGR